MVVVSLLGLGVWADYPYTREPASYGAGGLYIPALVEGLAEQTAYTIGNKATTTTMVFDELILSTLANSGFRFATYTANAEAEGDGAFTIPVNVPAGAVILSAQLRVDRLIEATTGVSWAAAFATGSTASIGSGLAFAQNTKAAAFFDANGATAITSDVTTITITPNAGTLDEGIITAVVVALVFETMADTVAVTYSAETFTEAVANDGTINNTTPVTITLSGATFAWANAVDFVSSGYLVVANLPVSLVVVASRTSSTVLSVTITGSADDHENADDVADLTFTLQDSAFAYGVLAADVVGYAKADLALDFSD